MPPENDFNTQLWRSFLTESSSISPNVRELTQLIDQDIVREINAAAVIRIAGEMPRVNCEEFQRDKKIKEENKIRRSKYHFIFIRK